MKHNWERDENGNINKWAWAAGFHNGVFCVDCGKSVCVHCKPDYMELDDCTGPQKPKVMTNADRIRAMSDEVASGVACMPNLQTCLMQKNMPGYIARCRPM